MTGFSVGSAAVLVAQVLSVSVLQPTTDVQNQECGEYIHTDWCHNNTRNGHGCQWCNNAQPWNGGSLCISKNSMCTDAVVAPKLAAKGVRAGMEKQKIAELLTEHDSRVARSHPQKLEGFFVRTCQRVGTTGAGQPVSTFDTRHYDSCYGSDTCKYELDRTYYAGDPTCKPTSADVMYKLNLHGNVSYYGASTVVNGAQKAEMHWAGATVFIASGGYYESSIKQLKICCPKVDWQLDTYITVTANMCDPVKPNDPQLCNLVAGSTDYFNYKWSDDNHYVTSRDDFSKLDGWANPIDYSYTRERIPQSGNNNPADCTASIWNECKEGILAAATDCQSCGIQGGGTSDLECEGCLFRELNPEGGDNGWKPNSNDNRWYNCCPCVWNYAKEMEFKWLSDAATHC